MARLVAAVLVLVLLPTAAGTFHGTAHALPDDPVAPPGVTLLWPALGLKPGIVLDPKLSPVFTVPVPAGLAAVRLLGMIHTPVNIRAGYIEVDDGDGKFLAAVDLPSAAPGQVVVPFDVDISTARFSNSAIDLRFTVRPIDNGDEFCGPMQQVVLSDLATVFTGIEMPATTIASFFPPILQQVTIYTPTDAEAVEQQSVLTLISTLARLYRSQPLAISVAAQPRGATPPPASQFARAIVVETGSAGVEVNDLGDSGTYLRISGRGDELARQLSLFVNELQTLVQTSGARVDQAGSRVDLSGDTMTFSQLQIAGKTDVLRTSSLTVGVERSALGTGRVDSLQVHLLADYTPVPVGSAAAVLIRSNGAVVFRAPLDNTGRLDANFDLEKQTLGQKINLDFALTFTPQEICGPLIAPITFQVDQRSTFTVRRGGPPPSGFSALPSEFSPSFMVALDGTSRDQLSFAARIVAAIARLSARPLTPKVVDLRAAADATSGALIVADSATMKKTGLNPPIAGDEAAIDVNLPTALRMNITDGLGSIQAFADRPRNRSVVLVTTTGAWNLVDPLFSYIEGLDGGWSALTGDVLAAGSAGVPTNVAIRGAGDIFEPPSDGAGGIFRLPSHGWSRWVSIGMLVALAAAVVLLATLWSRRRRPTAHGEADDESVTSPEEE